MTEEVFIPKLGQTVDEVTLIKWRVEDGVQVEQGQEILDIETDKAIFSVEAPAKGFIHVGPYKEGEVLPILTVIATIGTKNEKFEVKSYAPSADSIESPLTVPTVREGFSLPAQPKAIGRAVASPRAKKLARELNIDLSQVSPSGGGKSRIIERDVLTYVSHLPKMTPVARRMANETKTDLKGYTGSGPRGRITKSDVENILQRKSVAAPGLKTVSSPALPVAEIRQQIPMRGVRSLIADRMAMSVHTTARVTLGMEVDATEMVKIREQLVERVEADWGFSPGYNDLLGKITASALGKFPYMNARLAGGAIEILSKINIGMATDTERGLLVPVIRDADKMSLRQFGIEFRRLVEQAREGKISPDDLSGGTFTITNLGQYDIDVFTPIINLPEAAILGVGRIAPKVIALDGQAVIRTMCTLSLAFDHRLVDGAPAARFLQYLKNLIEEPDLWLIDMID